MASWPRELRLALRSLARQPGLAVLAVGTLALGIGANTAIFSVIEGTLLRPLPFHEPDRLVRLSDGHPSFGGGGINQSIPNLMDLRAGSRLLEGSAIYTFGSANLQAGDRAERVSVLRTSSEMLSVLGVTPQLGRDLLPEDDVAGSEAVALLTDATWRSRFGADRSIVGRSVTIDAAPVRVVGVAPAGFSFPFDPDVLVPLQHVGGEFFRGSRAWNAIGRLAPGAELEGLRVELQGIFDRLVEEYPGPNENWFTTADPLTEWVTGRSRQSLLLLAGAVALVLLIACVNVANLLIVRSEGRRREFALRRALGARRADMLPHFLSEGLVLALAGGGAGVVVAVWGVRLLVSLYGDTLARSELIALDGPALAFAVAVSVGVGLLVGLVPFLRTAPDDLHGALEGGTRGASSRLGLLGRSLVMSEVALAVLIVSGAGLLTRSLWKLQQVDTGVGAPEQVLTFLLTLPQAKYLSDVEIAAFSEEVVAGLERLPGVRAVGLVNRLPLLGGYNVTGVTELGKEEPEARFVSIRSVTPGYLEAAGVPLLAGRWLDPTEFENEEFGSTLVNQTLARQLFGTGDPVGRSLNPGWEGVSLRIVGVVGDIMGGDPAAPPPPAFYFPMAANRGRDIGVLVRAGMDDPLLLLPEVRGVVASVDEEVPVFLPRTLEEIALSRMGTRRFAMSLFGVFAALALLLGAVGVYGVMSYAVRQRAHELGVRLALGASRGSILWGVLAQGARVTLPGIAIGLALALLASRALTGLLYGVSALDATTYLGVAGMLALVSFGASGLPAYRATRVDPLESIRAE